MLQFPHKCTCAHAKKKKEKKTPKTSDSILILYNTMEPTQINANPPGHTYLLELAFLSTLTPMHPFGFNHKKKCTYKTIKMLDSKANGYDDLFRVIFGMPLPPNPPTSHFYAYVIGLSRCAPQKCFHQTISVIFCYF